jgi:anhydro-N-acetylmuramic acid kinase
MELFIGIMSGTSLDGIDVAVCDFSNDKIKLVHAETAEFSNDLKQRLQQLITHSVCDLSELGSTDVALAEEIALSINSVLNKKGIKASRVLAIGSHGQTIFHQPDSPHRFSLQIGNPNVIVEQTAITTIADFRQRDMALGGQGAPLVPAFHHALFQDEKLNRVIVNIGGISNITVLPAKSAKTETFGFDTGPGNTLLDSWCQLHLKQNYDTNGDWAETGTVNQELLNICLADSYFSQHIPKSTGREHFNLAWLKSIIAATHNAIPAADIQATLCQLTADSITNDINRYAPDVDEVYICGGGAYNHSLIKRLSKAFEGKVIASTNALGLAPDWVEAVAFAWFAKQTLNQKTVNLSTVTGAKHNTILGGIYYSSNDAS